MRLNVLILGGYSFRNIKWIKDMQELYQKDYDVSIVEYDNWKNNQEMNFEKEIDKIKELLKSKKIDIVIVKSIGIYLLSKALKNTTNKPNIIIGMGYPKKVFEEENINVIDDFINLQNSSKLLFIQQNEDPQCSKEELENILKGRINTIYIEGNNHSYSDYNKIKKNIDTFIKENH